MIRKLVTGLAVTAGVLGLTAGPAEAATIRCSTQVSLSGRHTNIHVASNHPNGAKVHSYMLYRTVWLHTKITTYIPYGPSLSVGGRYWEVRSWQSGTECSPWYAKDTEL